MGNSTLIADLESLLAEVKDLQFDDFKNTKYPAPKMALRQKFLDLAQNVVTGRYD